MSEPDAYEGREHSFIKHLVLEQYLLRLAIIVGSKWDTITYVDCFSGPWNVQSNDLHDSSFAIALRQLRKARDYHRAKGRQLSLRCFFLEKDPSAFALLDEYAAQSMDVEVWRENKALEDAVSDIHDFILKGGRSGFSFVFIDPKGWSGFGMEAIKPLLQSRSSEVLINFMTKFILRFIESNDPTKEEGFASLFGSDDYKLSSADASSAERTEYYVQRYCDNLKRQCGFNYTCAATILHPTSDQTHYHLIYGTRSAKGVEAFKAVEKDAMKVQEKTRAETRKRHRVQATGEPELFDAEEMHDSSYYDSLRERSLRQSKKVVLQLLESQARVPYDEAWLLALTFSLTWESDLKEWIAQWRKEKLLDVEGLESGKKVPQRGKNHILVWRSRSSP